MTDFTQYSEYHLFRVYGFDSAEIAVIKGITEHEAERRRIQQQREARDATSSYRGYQINDCQGEGPQPSRRNSAGSEE